MRLHTEYLTCGEMFVEEHKNKWNNPYIFNTKELCEESVLYYYGHSYFELRIGVWNAVDPLGEKSRMWSPYNYCVDNPVNAVDPDGKRILAATEATQKMILNTLPKEFRQYVSFNDIGMMNTVGLTDVKSNSDNFNTMRTIALSDKIMEVKLDNKFDYLDNNRSNGTASMGYSGVDHDFIGNDGGKGVGPSTGETGLLGKTLFPDKNGLQSSTNKNIIVIVNSGLSEKGKAEIYSYEANGHAYVYIQTNGDRTKATHQFILGGKDSNRYLFDLINKSMNETRKIMEDEKKK